jgi:hypothetical protein
MSTKSQQEKTAEFINSILADATPGARNAFTELLESCVLLSKVLDDDLRGKMNVSAAEETPVVETEESSEK